MSEHFETNDSRINIDKVAERHEEERDLSTTWSFIATQRKGTVMKKICISQGLFFSPNPVLFIAVERRHNILVINAVKVLLPKTISHSFAYHSPDTLLLA